MKNKEYVLAMDFNDERTFVVGYWGRSGKFYITKEVTIRPIAKTGGTTLINLRELLKKEVEKNRKS